MGFYDDEPTIEPRQTEPFTGTAHPLAQAIEDGGAITRVQTQYTTAMKVQNPRQLRVCAENALVCAAQLGEQAFYRWRVKDKKSPSGYKIVQGATVKMANDLFKMWGNCVLDTKVEKISAAEFVVYATMIDLETGATMTRPFLLKQKRQLGANYEADRAQEIAFQIGISKATRNVVLNMVPGWIVTKCIEEAQKGLRKRIEDAIAKRNGDKTPIVERALQKLAELGATEQRVLTTLNAPTRQAITVEDLVELHASIAAIESGEDTIDNVFPLPDDAAAAQAASGAQASIDAAKQVLAGPPPAKTGGTETVGEATQELIKQARTGSTRKPPPPDAE